MGLLTFFSPTAFRRRFRRFRRRSGRPWCRARLGSTGSGEGPGQVPENVPKKVPGGFGAEPGQVQQGSGERSGEGVGGFGAEPGQVSEKVKEGSRKPWWSGSTGSGRLQRRSWRRFWESLAQGQVRFNRFNRVSSAWLRSTLQKDL